MNDATGGYVKIRRALRFGGRNLTPGDVLQVTSDEFAELVRLGAAVPCPEPGRRVLTMPARRTEVR